MLYVWRLWLKGTNSKWAIFFIISFQIIIPFFSLFVKDLYFLNEGCSNKLPNGDINFEKFWQLAKQISDFITWQQVEVGHTYLIMWDQYNNQQDVFFCLFSTVLVLLDKILTTYSDYLCDKRTDNGFFLVLFVLSWGYCPLLISTRNW